MKRRGVTTMVLAAGLILPVATEASEAAGLKLIHTARDARTGADIRVRQGGPQDVQVEVQHAGLLVQKHVRPAGTYLTIKDGRDVLSVAMVRGEIAVTSRAGTVRVTKLNLVDMVEAQARLANFSGLGRAITLLRGLDIKPTSPLQPILLSLRAVLESARAEYHAAAALDDWHRALKDRVSARRVATQELTASECWDEYAKEAIRARIDYEHCTADLSWYELLDYTACATVYDLRAIGAMAWYLRCVGLGVNGAPLP